MPTSSKPRHGDPVVSIRKDALNNPLGVPTAQFQSYLDELQGALDALTTVKIETAIDYTQEVADKIIFATETLEITLLDPTLAIHPITIRNTGGITTLTGNTEISSLTLDTSTTLYPLGSRWTELQ